MTNKAAFLWKHGVNSNRPGFWLHLVSQILFRTCIACPTCLGRRNFPSPENVICSSGIIALESMAVLFLGEDYVQASTCIHWLRTPKKGFIYMYRQQHSLDEEHENFSNHEPLLTDINFVYLPDTDRKKLWADNHANLFGKVESLSSPTTSIAITTFEEDYIRRLDIDGLTWVRGSSIILLGWKL